MVKVAVGNFKVPEANDVRLLKQEQNVADVFTFPTAAMFSGPKAPKDAVVSGAASTGAVAPILRAGAGTLPPGVPRRAAKVPVVAHVPEVESPGNFDMSDDSLLGAPVKAAPSRDEQRRKFIEPRKQPRGPGGKFAKKEIIVPARVPYENEGQFPDSGYIGDVVNREHDKYLAALDHAVSPTPQARQSMEKLGVQLPPNNRSNGPLVAQLVALLSIYMPPDDFCNNPIVSEARQIW